MKIASIPKPHLTPHATYLLVCPNCWHVEPTLSDPGHRWRYIINRDRLNETFPWMLVAHERLPCPTCPVGMLSERVINRWPLSLERKVVISKIVK